jgi:hypothetical protein
MERRGPRVGFFRREGCRFESEMQPSRRKKLSSGRNARRRREDRRARVHGFARDLVNRKSV